MIHICFNLDKNYLNPCKVLIREIDSKTKDNITYHLIGIEKTEIETKNTCKFYPKPDLSFFKSENMGNYYYFTQAAMYRLLIPFMIDSPKALYMDIDTVVLKDLKPLYEKTIDYAGAVIDPCSIYHNIRLGLKADNYYNSGIILFNSEKIREKMSDYKEKILKAQEDYVLDLKDQDIFNIVFKDHITTLGYEYNIDAHNLKEKTETKQTSTLKDKAFNDPTIMHCMGKEKWWTCRGLAFGDYWDSYAKELIPRNRKYTYSLGKIHVIRN